jgi:hypothetical protein
MKTPIVYLIGSLRNARVLKLGNDIRKLGFEVFDDWHAVAPDADDWWRRYELQRQRNYAEALKGWAAQHIFHFDLTHLTRSDIGVLMLPAGKSGHLELGFLLGQGKNGFILLDKAYKRWDVMYNFATDVFVSKRDLFNALRKLRNG